jgi:hypothetical protein
MSENGGGARPFSSPLEDGDIFDYDRIIGRKRFWRFDIYMFFILFWPFLAVGLNALAMFFTLNLYGFGTEAISVLLLGGALCLTPVYCMGSARRLMIRKGYAALGIWKVLELLTYAAGLSKRLGGGYYSFRLLRELPSRDEFALTPIWRDDDLILSLRRAMNTRALAIIRARKLREGALGQWG